MAMVIRVRFKRAAKLYDFDPNGLELHNGMSVVTETARGVELGECMSGVMDVPDERLVLPLKPILRIATEQDLAMQKRNEQAEKEAFDIAIDRIAEHKLEMKLVDVGICVRPIQIIFYFTANGRVDFRMLVKSLASIFKTRIELRQIGVRDEAKMLGGIGPCGRPICCRTFLSDFTPVSIKMAKEQNLSLNPTKISGTCGRLMCCLKYEQDHYEQTRKRMPRVGARNHHPGRFGRHQRDQRARGGRCACASPSAIRSNCANTRSTTASAPVRTSASRARRRTRRRRMRGRRRKTPRAARRRWPSRTRRKSRSSARRGERPERAPRPERGPKPERGPRPERGERPPRPERGPRPPKKQADRPQDKEAPAKAEQPVVEEQKAVEVIDVLEIREDAKKEDLF